MGWICARKVERKGTKAATHTCGTAMPQTRPAVLRGRAPPPPPPRKATLSVILAVDPGKASWFEPTETCVANHLLLLVKN